MATVLANRCSFCTTAIKQPRTGRPRRFCSDRCRQKAHRDRQGAVYAIMAGPDNDRQFQETVAKAAAALPDELLGLPSDPDQAVLLTVREGWGFVSRLARCGERSRPELSWRCTKASEAVADILRRYFESARSAPAPPPE